MREDVQPSGVRHAHHELLGRLRRRLLHDGVEQRNQRFAAFQGEALLADVARVEELLEGLRRDDPIEQADPILRAELGAVARRLHPFLERLPLRFVADHQVLDAEREAVGLPECGREIA